MAAYILTVVIVAAGFSAAMVAAWWIQKRTGQSGWVDTIWTFAVGAAGVAFALSPPGPITMRQSLVAALAAFWSLRLGIHVAMRTARGGDDPRYAQLKKDWGRSAQARMFLFLQVQALAGVVLAVAILVAAHAPRPGLDARDALGAIVLLIGVAGETLADRQLRTFAANPANRGGVCDVGLWRWSRHPNYFFEWIGWFAYPVIAMSAGYAAGWLAWIGPVYIYYLLVHVSGIPALEDHMMRTRPAAFADYRRRTSAFFPAPRR